MTGVEEMLRAHGPWVRRLAMALAGSSAAAEDAAQDAWVAALDKPPATAGAARGWFRRVVKNRLMNAARADERRAKREHGAEPLPTASPEDVAVRVDLARQLAGALGRLPQAEQQVVFLRYYEDREPSEIARLLGVPAGTVRWRLSVALERLRRTLDETHGGRERWLAALVGWPRPATAPRGLRMVAAGAMLGALAIASASLVCSSESRSRAPDPSTLDGVRATPAGAHVSQRNGVSVDRCPESETLAGEVALREREVAAYERHPEEYERSDPNPKAEESFGRVIDRVVGAKGHCPSTLSCRGSICRLELLVLDDHRSYGVCFLRIDEPTIEFVPQVYLQLPRPSSVHLAALERDALTGHSYGRFEVFYRLASPLGEAVPLEGRPKVGKPSAGRHTVFDLLPRDRSAACRAEVARLRERLKALYARGDELMTSDEAFATSEPHPALEAEVVREVARVTGLAGHPFPLTVSCRGTICAVSARDADDPALGITQICDTYEGQPRCRASTEDDGWFARLWRASRHEPFFARVDPPMKRGPYGDSAWVRVRDAAEREPPSGLSVLCELVERVRTEALLPHCEREHPAAGTLSVQIEIPRAPEGDGAAITVRSTGTLAGTPLGRCIEEGLRAFAAKHAVPATREGALLIRSVSFPGATDILRPGDIGCAR